MAGWILLANVVVLIFFKPLLVNDPTDKPKTYSQNVADPTYLEFIDYKSGSYTGGLLWKDLCTIVVITGVLCLAIYQIVLTRRNDRETKAILKRCGKNHGAVKGVSPFYEETEKLFSSLDIKLKGITVRYDGVGRLLDKSRDFGRTEDDFKYIKENWVAEYSCLSRLSVTISDKPVRDLEVKAHLSMAKGIVDRELREIGEHMCEDGLSLEEVRRDVRMLQNYFRK